ncbi:MAG TPA: rhodanese-like domain-containing protein [Desulfovibrio sp.]|jgi:Rhodanese-related sulfurtransferase|uniref:rhodanese-like domain-containing protein n=1 Tax=Desulfovibrio TaxID=872 RepID=UPI0003F4C6C2|nr:MULTISPECIES: rhodanese-like domain-containing protein [Desulfovibrio]MDY0306189.1 rhodanese-like domain-containing protein [Desulfovibrionaceae bacterium]HMM37213.1 rhodanese-like domain-containing protein [Desulfovibrio sp.]
MLQMTAEEARRFLESRAAEEHVLVDVRQPFEYQEFHLPGARLIPLGELPERAGELKRDKLVLVYCRSGSRSVAAAGLLEGLGFSRVINLQGGIAAWQGGVAIGPGHQGLNFCLVAADKGDVLLLACGMEMILQEFYEDLMARAESQDVRLAFRQLAGFEVRHRERLYRLHVKEDAGAQDRASFEDQARSRIRNARGEEMAEGGVEPGHFLENMGLRATQARDALELAMQFEAQALDFYLRCSEQEPADAEKAKMLLQLGQEERAHLRMLGGLLERRAERG